MPKTIYNFTYDVTAKSDILSDNYQPMERRTLKIDLDRFEDALNIANERLEKARESSENLKVTPISLAPQLVPDGKYAL